MSETNLVVIARDVSSTLADGELTFLERRPIDVERARAQQRAYLDALARNGARVVVLPAEPEWPDAVFVEDTAIVVDELAVTTIPGSPSRRPEVISVADALARYRRVEFMRGPGTLDGGDVLRVERDLYVGISGRTTREGAEELRSILEPRGYSVYEVEVHGSLHLKTACTYLGRGAVLANREWIDASAFDRLEIVDVPAEEPWAANSLTVGGTCLVASCFPRTGELLASRGFEVEAVDISELQKAEAGLTCMSLLFQSPAPG